MVPPNLPPMPPPVTDPALSLVPGGAAQPPIMGHKRFEYEDPEPIKPPDGFKDPGDRSSLAFRCRRWIDDYNASVENTVNNWLYIQDVYDGVETPISLQVFPDVPPYNIPIMRQRVDAVVSSVAGPIIQAEPYFLFQSAGKTVDQKDMVDKTIHYALEQAGFDRRIKDAILTSTLKSRGILRLRYETDCDSLLAAQSEVDVTGDSEDGVNYTGLAIDVIMPENFVFYPTYFWDINKCKMVGHKFPQRYQDALNKQKAGRYFDDVTIPLLSDQPTNVTPQTQDRPVESDPQDFELLTYDLLVKLQPEGAKCEQWYQITVLYNTPTIVAMSLWEDSIPNYFAPTIRYEPNRFAAMQSVAETLIDIQRPSNDAYTAQIQGAVAGCMPAAVATGWTEDQVIPVRPGTLVGLRQGVQITPLPFKFDGSGLQFLIETLGNEADTLSRTSQPQLAQTTPASATATAINATAAGQQAGASDYVSSACVELERMADYARKLIRRNFDLFKAFHGDDCPANTADDLSGRYVVQAFGKNPLHSPSAQIQAIQSIVGLAKESGIQIDSEGYTLSGPGLMKLLFTLNGTGNADKLLNEPPPIPPQAQGPQIQGGPGAPGPIPPGLIAQLLQPGSGQGGLPQVGMGGRNPGGAPGLGMPGPVNPYGPPDGSASSGGYPAY